MVRERTSFSVRRGGTKKSAKPETKAPSMLIYIVS
ncbi:MAG: hypothetical protein UY61_C0066G0003 [Candidatus Adlerbacteria bacterium GW2011_GWC1_50_9]|uniref:Uncharacterized protein n=1 Tax=Candidatus Adlerbacteria bacterium GW2011_GWC1_50_9 TaxID=1618608 RepID=A0A0G1WKD4_9BACT|nr:MAG: hypothetical protein UY61_C0066G0003 [Candidatus Adlerbacteria bacterium GW2011_GWC1_50_9]